MDRTWKYEINDAIRLTNQGSLQMHNSDWWLFEVAVVENFRHCIFSSRYIDYFVE
jgi:hypothetical protein